MSSIALTISLRPAIKEQLAKEAKRRQMSMSRYIDELLEKHFEEDEDYTYTLEELDRDSREAKKLSDEGKLPSFDNVEDMIKSLKS
ncbi:MAG: hypothetical protein ACSW8C_01395 [bacterium]